MLDVMMRKGKGNEINKLRVAQIIEVDIQLLMTFLGMRIEENYENDNRMSKCNHGSRKGHSIESALLEKLLVFDLETKIEEEFSCATSDLEACHDRKLPNVGGIVEHPIRVNREAVNLLQKCYYVSNIA